MKYFLVAVFVSITLVSCAQELKKRVIWYLPAENTQINGIGAGVLFAPLYYEKRDTNYTQVNGLALELIGFGILMPLAPKSPNFPVDTNNIYAVLYEKTETNYSVNGIILSLGGHMEESTVNGVNISGIGTMTSQMNGFSIAFFQSHKRMNGLSIALGDEAIRHYGCHIAGWSEIHLLKGLQIGAFNTSAEVHGVQIGLLNNSKKLRGFQIGLWNVNEKRKLPIINWSFRTK